jgi:hypothetical protein
MKKYLRVDISRIAEGYRLHRQRKLVMFLDEYGQVLTEVVDLAKNPSL